MGSFKQQNMHLTFNNGGSSQKDALFSKPNWRWLRIDDLSIRSQSVGTWEVYFGSHWVKPDLWRRNVVQAAEESLLPCEFCGRTRHDLLWHGGEAVTELPTVIVRNWYCSLLDISCYSNYFSISDVWRNCNGLEYGM